MTDTNEDHLIQPGNLEIERFKVRPIAGEGTKTQFNGFPKYFFEGITNNFKDSDSVMLLTEPIKLTRGGIKRIDSEYIKNDDDRLFFYLAEDVEQPNSVLTFKDFYTIDKFYDKELNKNKNKNKIILSAFKSQPEKAFVDYKKYLPIVRPAEGPPTGAKVDTEFKPYNRAKINFNRMYNKDAGKYEDDITTELFLPNKDEPESVFTVTDFEKYYRFGCTAQYLFMIHKFWVQKSGDKGCGFGIKCLKIYISELSTDIQKPLEKFKNNIFISKKQANLLLVDSTDKSASKKVTPNIEQVLVKKTSKKLDFKPSKVTHAPDESDEDNIVKDFPETESDIIKNTLEVDDTPEEDNVDADEDEEDNDKVEDEIDTEEIEEELPPPPPKKQTKKSGKV